MSLILIIVCRAVFAQEDVADIRSKAGPGICWAFVLVVALVLDTLDDDEEDEDERRRGKSLGWRFTSPG